ncbi:MAG: LL-diaminopimelate aminotransferase [Ruminococcaceae bacterium]|nr:LL-diaminopimelate aminotransferase [Oscillospiraceae bacterium]
MKIKLNENYKNLKESYLFSEVAKRVKAYSAEHPEAKIIRLGIGDVTLPLTASVIEAMHKATDEMGVQATFRGYAPEHGYDFIREAVAKYYLERTGVKLELDEIFVGDGAKSDIANITDLFGDNEIMLADPVYPVYMDSNLMRGRKVTLLPANEANGFLPMPPAEKKEGVIVYLCSPGNPTGAVYSAEQLSEWVKYANETGSLIIFDSAYEAYVSDGSPRSIFEIEGSRTCAIEICSLSKTAGFTGTRCGWTIIPLELEEDGRSLAKMWERRQSTKFNGVPYVVQRAAEAAISEAGRKESAESIAYYMENAKVLASVMREKGISFTGGINSPYIWLKCPGGMGSWEFFDYLLTKFGIVGTPGVGFGAEGEGYFRLTAFGSHEATLEAAERLRKGL